MIIFFKCNLIDWSRRIQAIRLRERTYELMRVFFKRNLIDWDKRIQVIRLRERAYKCIYDDQIDDGLKLLQEALESDPNDYLAHFLLGLAFQKKADYSKALDKFQQIISLLENQRYKDSLPKDYLKEVQAYCNYYCGDAYSFQGEDFYRQENYEDAADSYNNAITRYRSQFELEPTAGFALTNIGYALLRQQEIQEKKKHVEYASQLHKEAREYFELGILRSPQGRTPNELYNLLYCFEGRGYFYYQSYLNKEANEEPSVDYEYYELSKESYKSALKLVEELVEKAKEESKERLKISKALVCNQLGNLFYLKENYRQAAQHYIKALRENRREAVYFANLGDACKQLKKLKFAAKAYKGAITRDSKNAGYLNTLGNIYYEMENYEQAAQQYIEALKKDPKKKVYESNLVLACGKLSDFSKAISSLESELQIKPECSQLRVVLKQLKSKQKYGAIHLDPLVIPIVVEVGRDLVPLVDDSNEEGRKFYKEKMVIFRDNLYQQLGIKFPPGIRFREVEDVLLQSSITIILHEVPIVRYETKGMYLINADKNQDSEKLKQFALDVEEETISLIPNTPLAWISSDQLERAEQAGYKIWDRQAYILFALARTLKLNAANFIGIQETQYLIEEWKKKSKTNQTLVENTIPDVIDISKLTLVFKRLVDEAIPILDFPNIFKAIQDNRKEVRDIILLTEKVRYGLRGILQQKYCDGQNCIKAHTMSEEIEQTFTEGIKKEADKGYLKLDVKATQDLLAAFREKLSTKRENIIVTRSPHIRPYVRELLKSEFPEVAVLCQAELEPEITIESIVTITILKQ